MGKYSLNDLGVIEQLSGNFFEKEQLLKSFGIFWAYIRDLFSNFSGNYEQLVDRANGNPPTIVRKLYPCLYGRPLLILSGGAQTKKFIQLSSMNTICSYILYNIFY